MAGKKTLIHIVSGNKWSGSERYALDICRHFKSAGWEVRAYTRDAKAVDSLFEEAGIELRHAPLHGFLDLPSAMMLARDMKSIPEGRGIVHAHRLRDAFTALLARKMAGRKDIKVISTRHKVRRGIDSWLMRRIYRNLDAMIFVSRLAMDRFLSSWPKERPPLQKGKMHVLHNSINISPGRPEPEPAKGPTVAMFHGPLVPGKGLETIIGALPRLKKTRARLRIVGSGDPDYADRLRRIAQTLGVMEMIDWKKHTDDPHPLINDCHFGVLPSTREEAFGLANIEYMAHGRPQITTLRGAQNEYLRDGDTALVVPPADSSALAEAMERLISDPGLRQKMGSAAFITFRDHLSWQRFIDRLTRLYLNI